GVRMIEVLLQVGAVAQRHLALLRAVGRGRGRCGGVALRDERLAGLRGRQHARLPLERRRRGRGDVGGGLRVPPPILRQVRRRLPAAVGRVALALLVRHLRAGAVRLRVGLLRRRPRRLAVLVLVVLVLLLLLGVLVLLRLVARRRLHLLILLLLVVV